jgi:hypothetical protein
MPDCNQMGMRLTAIFGWLALLSPAFGASEGDSTTLASHTGYERPLWVRPVKPNYQDS